MEKLEELIRILSSESLKRIEIINDNSNYNSLSQKLYDGIRLQKINSTEEAILYIYGKVDLSSKDKFNKLKKRLEERLVNSLFFINIFNNNFSESQKAYYKCYKEWAMIKILVGRTGRKNAIFRAEKMIKKAIEFEFSDIIIDLSRLLRRHYGLLQKNKKKFIFYDNLVEQYAKINDAEIKAESYYERLMFTYVHKRANPKLKDHQDIDHFVKIIKGLSTEVSSYKFKLFSNMILTLKYELSNDYKGLLKACDTAISQFEFGNSKVYKAATFHFYFKKLTCYTSLQNFQKGYEVSLKCQNLVKEGGINWYATLEGFLILGFHSKKYQASYEAFSKALNHKGFKKLPSSYKEMWKIYQAYIQYFLLIGKIKEDDGIKLLPFRLNRFLNDVPLFTHDKKGINVSILIIQTMFLLENKKFDEAIDKVDALNHYCYRYLRKDDTIRSNCFIKMLIRLIKSNFHKTATIRNTVKYRKLLAQNPIGENIQSSQVEIVPYEVLWDILLKSLDDKVGYK